MIDDLTADELFGTTDVLGRKVDTTINGLSFEAIIVGICKRLDITETKSNQMQGFAYIPISMLDNNMTEYNMQKIILSISDHQIEEAKVKITHFLLKRDVIIELQDIVVINQLELIDVFIAKNSILLWIAILWFVAAILGITNIMLVDIERNSKYYGLLSFYGSKSRDIKG